ncbi:alpha/beta fold hydrolase [Mariniblastus fucicola]|uniref:4,5:9,10-diseco-3-hydroxy-5,9, 17-trioxoandrosta-1(10),2-diene-4-oate hydrolase n=1 Tax=Mariniblastus fucicola TaxID=980251 RepID=A0A5B9P5N2_9BACT|nr:alpha/beta hydrolase [Mariniblastus fucicola]QEG20230.1 4,5:9,10-diseco-3-hydroxy-5,9,17-trioxoandrosta-1(10),2-diene-4-oate hydrolase [Mariniblastus fucicola]
MTPIHELIASRTSRSGYLIPVAVLVALACGALSGLAESSAQTTSDSSIRELGIRLEKYDYPFEVRWHKESIADREFEMAYMDVTPKGESKGTVVLLHGKNFSGAYWERTAKDLTALGYRVVIPDQIGFGKSSKPTDFQYSFIGMAASTKSLLDELKIERATILGHSMGGMLAARFALTYPELTEKLVLVNPIGLEDWSVKGVPYRGIDAWYQRELKKSAAGIKKYQLESYYDGVWKPEYQPWVDVLAGMSMGENYPQLALVQAQTYDMIYSQPVVHDLDRIKPPTLLIIGGRDRTALGKDLVSPEVKATLGQYQELGKNAASKIPDAKLVLLDGIGHLPHIEAYDRFLTPLNSFLRK